MSLPRRVPWLPDEFAYVFASIFASEGKVEIQLHGVQRIRAWMTRGCCPHAVESTATLLEALLLRGVSSAIMRNAFSMAITRLVNGLVDPLQQSMHAQSISKIAQQLNLPIWFVDLRHSATHQDLPSLAALRGACEKALDWLYQRYWLPQMNSLNGTPNDERSMLQEQLHKEFAESVRAFKIQRKEAVRDVSRFRPRDLVRSCAAIGELLLIMANEGHKGDSIGSAGVEILIEALLDSGALVPTSKRKRCTPRSSKLSTELVEIWTPLLEYFDEQYSSFSRLLAERMIDVLHSNGQDDVSYSDTLAPWLALVVDRFLTEKSQYESILRYCLLNPNTYTLRLVQQAERQEAGTQITALLPLMQVHVQSAPGLTVPDDEQLDAKFKAMKERFRALPARAKQSKSTENAGQAAGENAETLPAGWSTVKSFKPSPIGALLPGVDFHQLLLSPRM